MTVLTSPEQGDEYLTVAEVADELRCSEPTIRRRIRAGDLAAVKLGSRRNALVRVSRVALAEWLEDNFDACARERNAPGPRVPSNDSGVARGPARTSPPTRR
jgi:excisionase family DNA binding protein